MRRPPIARWLATLAVAAVLFGLEIVGLVPWVNRATQAYLNRPGASHTPAQDWGMPVLIALWALAVFAVAAWWVARLIVARRWPRQVTDRQLR